MLCNIVDYLIDLTVEFFFFQSLRLKPVWDVEQVAPLQSHLTMDIYEAHYSYLSSTLSSVLPADAVCVWEASLSFQ